MGHFMEPQINRIARIDKSFHKTLPGDHNDAKPGVNLAFVVAFADG
jgi:hypothetical protein